MDAAPSPTLDRPADAETAPAVSAQERLIAAATRLFCRYGVNSVGVDAIVEAAGTAKTTLYKAFGSKDGLVEVVLEREGQAWRSWFISNIDGPGGTPLERLARIAPTLKIWFERDDFYGCPFINVVGESDKADDRMRSLALAHKKVVLDRLSQLCVEAGFENPEQVAHALGLTIDGAIVSALVTRNPDVAAIASNVCDAVLKNARH